MLIVHQIKIPCDGREDVRADIEKKFLKVLRITPADVASWKIVRHSVDARKKPVLFHVYSAGVSLRGGKRQEEKVLRRLQQRHQGHNVVYEDPVAYCFPKTGGESLVPGAVGDQEGMRPVVVGFGPAGMFCGLLLARAGLRPIILERGHCMEERTQDVERFWKSGVLDPASNCQFGEGGAGTFSDGKLNTNVKDRNGRTAFVMQTLIDAGAPEDIAYEFHPHIGTDVLRRVVVHLRREIISLGGEVRFNSVMTDLDIRDGQVCGVTVSSSADGASAGQDGRTTEAASGYYLRTSTVILAPGHSARDTIRHLLEEKVPMEQKAFAVGLRVSHPQPLINASLYGISDPREMDRLHLSAASYKLVARSSDGRGVYSFCMCPGGYIVNASSENHRLAVNGMSDCARDSRRANSAIVVTVDSSVYGGEDILSGMRFQERLEEKAWALAQGRIGVERYPDFEKNFEAGCDVYDHDAAGDPLDDPERLCLKGQCHAAPVHTILPRELTRDFIEGMQAFAHKIPGYTGDEALVCGVESRTSSPVRIVRGEDGQSSIRGLFPCGEGAGYAGGITSAAIDGCKAAEAAVAWMMAQTGTEG